MHNDLDYAFTNLYAFRSHTSDSACFEGYC